MICDEIKKITTNTTLSPNGQYFIKNGRRNRVSWN